MQIREENTSVFLSECIELFAERYKEKKAEVEEILININGTGKAEIKAEDLSTFLPQLNDILDVRVIKLDVTKPKSDENVCDINDEKAFYDSVMEIAQYKEYQLLNYEIFEQLMNQYFNELNCKF